MSLSPRWTFFLRAESINDQVNLSDYMVTQNMGFIFEYLIMFFCASLAILKIINKVLEVYFCSLGDSLNLLL